MPEARVFKVENRLAKVVKLPGGKTVAEALAGADRRIESLRDGCLKAMEAQAARLAELAARGRAGGEVALVDDIYRIANEVFGIAGTFGLDELGAAAYSLCDLADRFRILGEVNWSAIDVHVDGIRLLASVDSKADAPMRAEIVAGLKAISARFMAKA